MRYSVPSNSIGGKNNRDQTPLSRLVNLCRSGPRGRLQSSGGRFCCATASGYRPPQQNVLPGLRIAGPGAHRALLALTVGARLVRLPDCGSFAVNSERCHKKYGILRRMTENIAPSVDTLLSTPAPTSTASSPEPTADEGDVQPGAGQAAIDAVMQAAEAAVSGAVQGMATSRSPS